ncbi:MAG: hypothetical protein DRO73_08505 [Candidatus Thorarchaeota archaeon]|nr:MAG: hypothetical protein DRO73_08505 [Candidatus Thorarchaeota archaeon]
MDSRRSECLAISLKAIRLVASAASIGVLILAVGAPSKGSSDSPSLAAQRTGYAVAFQGFRDAVRVYPLAKAMTGAAALSPAIISQIDRARERNARWLIRQHARTLETSMEASVSFTLVADYPSAGQKAYPYAGRYCPGIVLQRPSEFMLYYCNPQLFEYSEDSHYFRIIRRGYRGESDGVLQPYVMAGGLVAASVPPSWLSDADLLWFGRWEKYEMQPGHELWFEKEDYRLVKEVSSYTGEDGAVGGRIEATYVYKDSVFPHKAVILSRPTDEELPGVASILLFQEVDGLLFIEKGVLQADLTDDLEDILRSSDDKLSSMGGVHIAVTGISVVR